MIVFINGSFGIGKTTVARLLAAQLPGSLVFDPGPMGILLMHIAALRRRPRDDFQDLVAWRWLGARAIRIARGFRSTVVVPMAFSNLAYLGEFLSYLRERHARGGREPRAAALGPRRARRSVRRSTRSVRSTRRAPRAEVLRRAARGH